MHHAAQLLPLVHAAKSNPVADAERYPFCKIGIVGNQDGLAVADIQDETLMTAAIAVIRKEPNHKARTLDPGIGILLAECAFQVTACPIKKGAPD